MRSRWVDPEWIPSVPRNDRGPFYCYVLWLPRVRQYYVGHTGNLEERLEAHFGNEVPSTRGLWKDALWVSSRMYSRTEARELEAVLKSWIKSGNSRAFERRTGCYLARGARLRELF